MTRDNREPAKVINIERKKKGRRTPAGPFVHVRDVALTERSHAAAEARIAARDLPLDAILSRALVLYAELELGTGDQGPRVITRRNGSPVITTISDQLPPEVTLSQ